MHLIYTFPKVHLHLVYMLPNESIFSLPGYIVLEYQTYTDQNLIPKNVFLELNSIANML